jgi:hypothetical protein
MGNHQARQTWAIYIYSTHIYPLDLKFLLVKSPHCCFWFQDKYQPPAFYLLSRLTVNSLADFLQQDPAENFDKEQWMVETGINQ